ncbi:MAG: polysaccharide biosynthesis C-terminal domain-containing protein [Prolixibacteraceae bacterium]|nr:polysaccharide biosynthesis C-terminal domain-containing protein [Prolixibacteraceae bacterium]
MNTYKKLASDTVIYGMSSIIGRVLNWFLVPYYVILFEAGTFAIITNLYAYAAVLLIVLTYGLETGFFRFASKADDLEKVYSTSLYSIFFTTSVFLALVFLFKNSIAGAINYENHTEYIIWFAIILCLDTITAIPFARLRLKNRPIKFAFIKLVNIGFAIALNIFFLSVCPKILEHNPNSWIRVFYSPEIGVGYVFISNLLASVLTIILLFSELIKIKPLFDYSLLKKILSYSFPILIVGLAGILNQNIDKILIPFLIPEEANPMVQLGVYGASFKLAVLMNMFIQAFRYAFEPFFFSRKNSQDDKIIYAIVLKYFVIFGLLIFLGMMFYIDIINFIFDGEYQEGLKVLPIILIANLFFGIYFNLSLWYKLTDKTRYGAYIASIGSILTIVINFVLIPFIGYLGSAFAFCFSSLLMTVLSYFLGKKHYPVPYDLKSIFVYFGFAFGLYFISVLIKDYSGFLKYGFNTVLLMIFLFIVYYKEKNQIKRLLKVRK